MPQNNPDPSMQYVSPFYPYAIYTLFTGKREIENMHYLQHCDNSCYGGLDFYT